MICYFRRAKLLNRGSRGKRENGGDFITDKPTAETTGGKHKVTRTEQHQRLSSLGASF
jgi:hypothetical protein